jgi:O-Antigen ligase
MRLVSNPFFANPLSVLLPGMLLVVTALSNRAGGLQWWVIAATSAVCLPWLLTAGSRSLRPRIRFLPFLLVLAWILLQAANPSHRLSEGVVQSLEPLDPVSWLPSSVSRADTLPAAGVFTAGVVVWATARGVISRVRADVRTAVILLCLGSSAFSIVAILQRLEPVPFPVFPVTGTFVNENNFAAATNLLLPLTLWLAVDFRRKALERGHLSHPGPLFVLMAGVQFCSVLLSGSRAGIAISLAILTATGILEFLRWRQLRHRMGTPSLRPVLLSLAALLLVGILVGGPVIRREFATIRNVPRELSYRARLCSITWNMFTARWFAGTGAGTFGIAFPYYRPADFTGRPRHTHCDPLQTLAELGLAGTALSAAALMTAARRRSSPLRAALAQGLRFAPAAAIGLAGLATHACLDFPFREPAVFLTACLLLGLWTASGGRTSVPASREEPA